MPIANAFSTAEEQYLHDLRTCDAPAKGDPLHWGVDIRNHLPILRFLARGNVLEIGCRRTACSTAALLCGVHENGGHVFSVDLETEGPCSLVYAHDPQWTFIHGHSRDDFERIRREVPGPLDLLMIDGDHSQTMVYSDLCLYQPLVRPGGFTLLHDVDFWDGNPDYCGVRQAIERYGKPARFLPGSYGLGIIAS